MRAHRPAAVRSHRGGPGHAHLTALTLAVVASALALAGCSGAPSAPVTVTVTAPAVGSTDASTRGTPASGAAAGSVDGLKACSVLTKSEAAAIVDAKLKDGVEGNPNEPSCEYDTDPNGPKTAQVRLVVGDGAEQTYRTDKRTGHVFAAVPGLGDEAWQEPFAIFVRKGGTWFGITVVLLEDQSVVVKPLQTAAAAISPRIP